MTNGLLIKGKMVVPTILHDATTMMSNQQFNSKPDRGLAFPSGPVPLDSPFYVDRPPIEELACNELGKAGSVIRIRAPRKMGKSSLSCRIIDRAKTLGYRSAIINFQQADESVFASLDKFLRWFCAYLTRQLKLKPMLDDYWDEDMGSKVSCTIYLEGYLLEEIDSPIVLVLNEINRVFEYPKIAADFLPLLRFWHEQAKQVDTFEKLRLVVVHSTEIYIPLNINQSPFNVGLPIKLPEFNLEQVRDLATRHQLNWTTDAEADRLMAMVGGHPYLVRLALYHLVVGESGKNLEQLLAEAATPTGIYSNHLRDLLAILRQQPKLAAGLKQVLAAPEVSGLDSLLAYELESMGLVKFEGDRVRVSCELYRRYFTAEKLEVEEVDSARLQELEKENEKLKNLVNIDGLTQIANRRYFDRYLETEWRRLAREVAPIALILCDVDCFKAYNDTYGHQAGDVCLQQVAEAIGSALKRPGDLAARYGGEEFAAILPHTDAMAAMAIAADICNNLKAKEMAHINSKVALKIVTISLGIACIIPNTEIAPNELLKAADEALYHSKETGRDRFTLSSTFNYQLSK